MNSPEHDRNAAIDGAVIACFGNSMNVPMLAAIAGVGLALYLLSMPETRGHHEKAKSV